MEIQQDLIRSKAKQKGHEIAEALEESLKSYQLADENIKLQENRKQLLEDKIALGAQLDFFGLLSVLQDNLSAQVRRANALANYRTARAQAWRALLIKSYQIDETDHDKKNTH